MAIHAADPRGPLLQVMADNIPTDKIQLTRSEKRKAILCAICSCGLSVKCSSDWYFEGLLQGDAEGIQSAIDAIKLGACVGFGPNEVIIAYQSGRFYGTHIEVFHNNQVDWPLCEPTSD